MAYHLIRLGPHEHRITDDANNWSDPLAESPYEGTAALATTGNLGAVTLHPMTARDIVAASTATNVRTSAT